MQISGGRDFSYCLNVHPGETLDDILQVIRTQVPEIKKAISPAAPFGLGLRIARKAAQTLQDADRLNQLKQAIQDQNCYAFTINGFPFGAFHQTRVKAQVYLPDWSDPARLDYTRDLFDQLAVLLPDHTQGSVSTVPLGYKFASTPFDIRFACKQLCELATHLHHLEERTGRHLHLGLEPEPDCLIETTPETLAFFKDSLFSCGLCDVQILRRHIGVCLDTCHLAMQFEDPAESVRQLTADGILISKTQISAALECDATIDPRQLQAFDDGVYLHQTRHQNGQAWRDLPDFFASPSIESGTLRTHAHVPLHWADDGDLRSTRHTLTPAFWQALADTDCKHLEVETYTFDVLPEALRAGRNVAQDMIAECQWALNNIVT